MATIRPFRAVRPLPEIAADVACVPYDVINRAEAKAIAKGSKESFVRVIRAEVDLPLEIDEHDDLVYQKAADNMREFVDGNTTIQEDEPSLYVYRIIMNGHPQVGVFGGVTVDEYDRGLIVRHENTRPDKEDDRTRHILEQQGHAEPVMLTYRDSPLIDEIVSETMQGSPLYDFQSDDGNQHTVWKVNTVQDLVDAFATVPNLYVADGHHRCKAASRACQAEKEAGQDAGKYCDEFPAVIVPMGQMEIMAYNRLIRTIGMTSEEFLAAVQKTMEVRTGATPKPSHPGQVSFYLSQHWYSVTLPPSNRPGASDQLDVARLGEFILEPLLNIADQRTDPNISFVGGIRGVDPMKEAVDSGQAELAFSLYATSIEELLLVSDAGELMPPKSTWFEPKLRSGLLVHLF